MPTLRKASDGNYYREASDGNWYPVDSVQADEALSAGLREPTSAESILGRIRDVNQGLSLGSADEIEAGMGAAVDKLSGIISGNPVDFGERYRENKADIHRQMEAHEQRNKFSSPALKFAGGLGTAVASAPLAAGKGLLGLAGLGALEGGITGYNMNKDPNRVAADTLTGIAAGGALGAAAKPVANVAGRVVQSPLVRGPLNSVLPDRFHIPANTGANATMANVPPAYRDSVATADDLGFKLTPYQRTQDADIGQIEAAMSSKFGGAGVFDNLKSANQDTLNDVVAQSIHQKGRVNLPEAHKTNQALWKASEASGEQVQLDLDAFDTAITKADDYIARLGKGDPTPKLIDDVYEAVAGEGVLTPKEFQHLYSGLNRDINSAYRTGNGELAEVYQGLQRALDASVDSSAPETSKLLREARSLYRKRMPLERAGVVNAATGDVNFGPLSRAYRRDKTGYIRGGNQSKEYDLARLYEAFGQDIVGNSGTATRAQGLADYFMFAKPRELAAKAYLNNPAYTRGGLLSPTTMDTSKAGAAIPPLLAIHPELLGDERRR